MVKQEETVKIKILHGSMDYIEGTESNFTSVILLRAGLRSKGLGGGGWGVCVPGSFTCNRQPKRSASTGKTNKEKKGRKKKISQVSNLRKLRIGIVTYN